METRMPEAWHKLNRICRDPHESQTGREAAYLMKEMAEALKLAADYLPMFDDHTKQKIILARTKFWEWK